MRVAKRSKRVGKLIVCGKAYFIPVRLLASLRKFKYLFYIPCFRSTRVHAVRITELFCTNLTNSSYEESLQQIAYIYIYIYIYIYCIFQRIHHPCPCCHLRRL